MYMLLTWLGICTACTRTIYLMSALSLMGADILSGEATIPFSFDHPCQWRSTQRKEFAPVGLKF